MRYTIEGFSQEYSITLRKNILSGNKEKLIKIDCTDLVILRWFVDFFPNMKKMTIDGVEYAWLSHKKLQEDLPILDISKRACIERMQKLVEFGILKYKLVKEGGTFSLYAFGENYIKLLRSDADGVRSNDIPCDDENAEGVRSSDIPCAVQEANKDSSIKDDSFNSSIRINYQEIADLFNEICVSYPSIRVLTDARKKTIKALIQKGYTISTFKEIFERAEQSTFLKGGNDRNWSATFDWMMKDANAVKILEGNYTDKAPVKNNASGFVEVNGKQYIFKNGKYYIPNGNGIAVNPNADDDLPF